MDFIWIILLIVLGLAGAICPEKLWKLEHWFSVRGGEPSEAYLVTNRIFGVIFTIVGLFCAAVAIWG